MNWKGCGKKLPLSSIESPQSQQFPAVSEGLMEISVKVADIRVETQNFM
jgi:hypothetical protein